MAFSKETKRRMSQSAELRWQRQHAIDNGLILDKVRIVLFLAGWFDPLDKRLAHIAAYDAARKRERKTTTVRLRLDRLNNSKLVTG